jgi:hypothetical protein
VVIILWAALFSNDITIRFKIVQADSSQVLSEFIVGASESESADPFYHWLHDEHAVRIDWNTFGINQLKSE